MNTLFHRYLPDLAKEPNDFHENEYFRWNLARSWNEPNW